MIPSDTYTLIENNEALSQHCQTIQENSSWLGFDTEFIGEKRYVPLLCWVQISSEAGNFLIDALACDDFSPLTTLLEDPAILKISHAGKNDYQLFYKLFKTLPKNIVDIQIAVGFLGDGYPCSFQKIAYKYADARISKSQTVTDWSKRPITPKQIKYALNDVIYLHEIWGKLKQKLEQKGRLAWVVEECSKFCEEECYTTDLLKDLLSSKIMASLAPKEQIFKIRLHQWREKEAESHNWSREKVLSSKTIPTIVKMMHGGEKSLLSDRRIPDYIIRKHINTLKKLYDKAISEEERELLKRVTVPKYIPEKHNIIMDLLNQVFKFICVKNKIAGTLLMPRADFNQMKFEPNYIPDYLKQGWRVKILGADMVEWLENRLDLDIQFVEGEVRMVIKKNAKE